MPAPHGRRSAIEMYQKTLDQPTDTAGELRYVLKIADEALNAISKSFTPQASKYRRLDYETYLSIAIADLVIAIGRPLDLLECSGDPALLRVSEAAGALWRSLVTLLTAAMRGQFTTDQLPALEEAYKLLSECARTGEASQGMKAMHTLANALEKGQKLAALCAVYRERTVIVASELNALLSGVHPLIQASSKVFEYLGVMHLYLANSQQKENNDG